MLLFQQGHVRLDLAGVLRDVVAGLHFRHLRRVQVRLVPDGHGVQTPRAAPDLVEAVLDELSGVGVVGFFSIVPRERKVHDALKVCQVLEACKPGAAQGEVGEEDGGAVCPVWAGHGEPAGPGRRLRGPSLGLGQYKVPFFYVCEIYRHVSGHADMKVPPICRCRGPPGPDLKCC